MARRVSRVEKAKLAANPEPPAKPVETDLVGLAERIVGGKLQPTQAEYMFDPERVKWYVGRVGAAKTSSLCGSVILPALLYPGSKWLVARWTYWTLQETTMERFDECLARLGPNAIIDEIVGPPRKIWIAPAVQGIDGKPAEPSEIIFHSLDELSKLGSTQFNGIAVDEANEIEHSMAVTLNQRLRRGLPGQSRPEGPWFLNLASNPPDELHWLHHYFCDDEGTSPEKMGKKFTPRLDENLENLPEGYYETIAKGMSPQMRIRMIEGRCGPDPTGKPVFPEFRQDLHVGSFKYVLSLPIMRSWDFGRRRPCCIWAQQLKDGRIVRYRAELGENESTDAFAKRVLMLSGMYFPVCAGWIDFCDPHGTARKSTSDKSDVDILNENGIFPRWRDVAIKTGLDLMSKGLNTLIAGVPQSVYDVDGAKLLINGYGGGYTWPKGNQDKPRADGYYEHPMDCDRYLMVNLMLGSTSAHADQPKVLRKVRSPVTGY